MKKGYWKTWQNFPGECSDGNGGRIFTGDLSYPITIASLTGVTGDTRCIDAGVYYSQDRRFLTRLFGRSGELLDRFKEAVDRLDKLTEDSTSKRGWLDDYQRLISEIETDAGTKKPQDES